MNEPHFLRAAHVTNYILDKASVPKYKGELLPFIDANIYNGIHDDANGYGLIFSTDGFPWINAQKFDRLRELCENSAEENIYRLVYNDSRAAVNNISPCRYDHGGTHNIPDIPTVLHNGLLGYQTKIDNERKHTDDVMLYHPKTQYASRILYLAHKKNRYQRQIMECMRQHGYSTYYFNACVIYFYTAT